MSTTKFVTEKEKIQEVSASERAVGRPFSRFGYSPRYPSTLMTLTSLVSITSATTAKSSEIKISESAIAYNFAKQINSCKKSSIVICNHCGQSGHSRITSKHCAKYDEYRQASADVKWEMLKLSRKKTEEKRKDDPKFKKSRKKTEEKRKDDPKRQKSRKDFEERNGRRHGVAARAKEAKWSNVYQANRHLFAKYAAADLADRSAGHVNISREDILEKNIFEPLTDKEILNIKKRWESHMKAGANRDVCATCGIVGLPDATEFDTKTNKCIQAFKVYISTIYMCLFVSDRVYVDYGLCKM